MSGRVSRYCRPFEVPSFENLVMIMMNVTVTTGCGANVAPISHSYYQFRKLRSTSFIAPQWNNLHITLKEKFFPGASGVET